MCKSLPLLLVGACACLVSVNFSQPAYPEFRPFDYGPYLVLLSEPWFSVSFQKTEEVTIWLDNMQIDASFNYTHTALAAGVHSFDMVCSKSTYSFDLFVVSSTDLEYTVLVDDKPLEEESTVDSQLAFVHSPFQLVTKSFSLRHRENPWKSITELGLGLPLNQGKNYLLMQYGDWANAVEVHRRILATEIVGIRYMSQEDSGYIWPRVSPGERVYEVLPFLTRYQRYTLSIETQEPCDLHFRSQTGLFAEFRVASGKEVTFESIASDTLFIAAGAVDREDVEYYSLSVRTKSRNQNLNMLQLRDTLSKTQLPFTQPFTHGRSLYHLLPINYSSARALELIVVPVDSSAILEFQENFRGYQQYVLGSTVVYPVVGDNRLDIKVTAEDPAFINVVSVVFRMKSSDSTLSNIDIPGDWVPAFRPTWSLYRIYVDPSHDKVPVTFLKSDPHSTVVTALDGFNKVSDDFIAVSDQPVNLTLAVFAETPGFLTTYQFLISTEDTCGNGRRYSPVEDCDDGNTQSGDGCSLLCRIETGFYCSGGTANSSDICVSTTEQIEPHRCGDGRKEEYEECDDGNRQDGDGCDRNCRAETNGRLCGDGIQVPPEECDDGNTVSGDGCFECQVERGWQCNNVSALTRQHPMADLCIPLADSVPKGRSIYTHIANGLSLAFSLLSILLLILNLVSHYLEVNSKTSFIAGLLFYIVNMQTLYFLAEGGQPILGVLEAFRWSVLECSLGLPGFQAISILLICSFTLLLRGALCYTTTCVEVKKAFDVMLITEVAVLAIPALKVSAESIDQLLSDPLAHSFVGMAALLLYLGICGIAAVQLCKLKADAISWKSTLLIVAYSGVIFSAVALPLAGAGIEGFLPTGLGSAGLASCLLLIRPFFTWFYTATHASFFYALAAIEISLSFGSEVFLLTSIDVSLSLLFFAMIGESVWCLWRLLFSKQARSDSPRLDLSL